MRVGWRSVGGHAPGDVEGEDDRALLAGHVDPALRPGERDDHDREAGHEEEPGMRRRIRRRDAATGPGRRPRRWPVRTSAPLGRHVEPNAPDRRTPRPCGAGADRSRGRPGARAGSAPGGAGPAARRRSCTPPPLPTKGGHADDGADEVLVGRQRDGVDAGAPEGLADGRFTVLGRRLEPAPEARIAGVDVELLAGLGVLEDDRPDVGQRRPRAGRRAGPPSPRAGGRAGRATAPSRAR